MSFSSCCFLHFNLRRHCSLDSRHRQSGYTQFPAFAHHVTWSLREILTNFSPRPRHQHRMCNLVEELRKIEKQKRKKNWKLFRSHFCQSSSWSFDFQLSFYCLSFACLLVFFRRVCRKQFEVQPIYTVQESNVSVMELLLCFSSSCCFFLPICHLRYC